MTPTWAQELASLEHLHLEEATSQVTLLEGSQDLKWLNLEEVMEALCLMTSKNDDLQIFEDLQEDVRD